MCRQVVVVLVLFFAGCKGASGETDAQADAEKDGEVATSDGASESPLSAASSGVGDEGLPAGAASGAGASGHYVRCFRD